MHYAHNVLYMYNIIHVHTVNLKSMDLFDVVKSIDMNMCHLILNCLYILYKITQTQTCNSSSELAMEWSRQLQFQATPVVLIVSAARSVIQTMLKRV